MEIKIVSTDVKLTEAINSYVENKLERIEKYFKNSQAKAEVTLKIEKNTQIVEIHILAEQENFRAVTDSDDMYASIDNNIDVLEGQIRKAKTIKEKMQKDSSLKDMGFISDEVSDERVNEVLKTSFYDIKPLSVEDAILVIQEKPKTMFLTFINIDTGKVNVLYRLDDKKNFGLSMPEA